MARLALSRRRRVTFIQQLTPVDCGAACLAMVLTFHGRQTRLGEVRDLMQIGRDGTSALAILETADRFGLIGRGIRIEPEEFQFLDAGTVLHWEFNHFVVFERLHDDGVDIVDPAVGRRRLSHEEVRRAFTGVALTFEPNDSLERQSAPTQSPLRHLRAAVARSRGLPRIIVVSIALQLFALSVPVLTGVLVDQVVPRADTHLLAVVGVGLGLVVAFHFASMLLRSHLLLQLRTLFDAQMTLGFLDHLVNLPYSFFLRRSAGDLMNRLNSNTTIREILTSGALSAVIDGAFAVVYLAILVAASPVLGVIVLLLAVLEVAGFVALRRRMNELMSRTLASQARSASYVVDLLAGIETLKAAAAERRAVERWSHLYVDALNVALERGRINAVLEAITGTLRIAAPVVVLIAGAMLVLEGRLTLGSMLALNAVAIGFLTPVSNMVATAAQLQTLGSYLERIEDVLRAAPEQDRAAVRPAPALSGRITVERACFRYDGAAPLVVDDVSFEVAPGQMVAIVGRSGSGKSTLAGLLVGLYRPTEGRVLYDGLDLASLDMQSVRAQIGMVPQVPHLFGASVRDNIALTDPSLSLEAVQQSARLAQIHDEVAAMPMGYETVLADGGMSLSGGQRQRLSLARALARRPAVLLLDEATSSLDAVKEREVQRALASLRCTRIVIAHRLSTVIDADMILVMEGGRIVERGVHAELLAGGGLYARLAHAQLSTAALEGAPAG